MKIALKILLSSLLSLLSLLSLPLMAEELTADLKTRLESMIPAVEALAQETAVVSAVSERNSKVPTEWADMNQEKWKTLKIIEPQMKALLKNPASEALKAFQKKHPAMIEAFVSASDGTKVAFISKSSNWSHQGKPKHDVPMSGKKWTGPVEVDNSSGVKQIQVSVPVMNAGKPAGSLVVAFQIQKL